MKRIYFLFLSFFFVTLVNAQPALHQLLNNPALKHASVGVHVVNLNTGRTVVSHDAEKSLTPASTMKLVTTATALELLGPDFRYKTILALDADMPKRILVIGSGDPTLGSEAFGGNPKQFLSDWAVKLASRCAAKDVWQLYVVDNLFGYDGISPEWTWIDMGNYYAAGAYGISVFDNTYRLYFDTTDRNSCPKILRTDPEIKGLTFANSLSLNSSGSDNGYIFGVPFSNERIVRGDIPAGRNSFSIKGDIPDPGLLLGEMFTEYLRREGVNVESVQTAREDYLSRICDRTAEPYSAGEVLHEHLSRPLSDIIRETNVESNNHYAEHLIRTVGRNRSLNMSSDALKEGIDYVTRFWKSKNVDPEALNMEDGCGLAPQDAVSPDFLTGLLSYMYTKSSYKDTFFDSLPKAGEEGTLTYFLDKTKYQGKIHAKSGSIGGVQCYAGYLIDGNKKYAFSIMVNKFNGARSEVRSAIEKFLLSL